MYNWQQQIPPHFAKESRVWIYQAARRFTMPEALHIESLLDDFVANWHSHGSPVKGFATLLFGQFVVIMADETATGVSGCSTDSSVRVIREIEAHTGVPMFSRTTLAFWVNNKVELIPMNQAAYALQHGIIGADTLYFNNLVATKEALLHQWLIPVKQSWLISKLPQLA